MTTPIKPEDIKKGDRITITMTVTVDHIGHHENGSIGGGGPWTTIFYEENGGNDFSLEFPLHLKSSEQATFAVSEA